MLIKLITKDRCINENQRIIELQSEETQHAHFHAYIQTPWYLNTKLHMLIAEKPG